MAETPGWQHFTRFGLAERPANCSTSPGIQLEPTPSWRPPNCQDGRAQPGTTLLRLQIAARDEPALGRHPAGAARTESGSCTSTAPHESLVSSRDAQACDGGVDGCLTGARAGDLAT